jgi:hypothetical protein
MVLVVCSDMITRRVVGTRISSMRFRKSSGSRQKAPIFELSLSGITKSPGPLGILLTVNPLTQVAAMPKKSAGHSMKRPVPSTSAAPPRENIVPRKRRTVNLTPERLTKVRYVSPSTIFLRFADGFSSSLNIKLLDMPSPQIQWSTLRASPNGEKIIVKVTKGGNIPIDTATLRYLVDEKYAAKMDAKLKSLQFSEDELEKMVGDNPPPDAWFDEPEPDLTHESWK